MKNKIKIMVWIFVFGLFGVQCPRKQTSENRSPIQAASVAGDSQLADDRQMINEDISQSRQNAITRAVSQVSPAVVGINVIQIRRYVQRSPFEDDPFWGWFYRPREYMQQVQSLGSGFLISPNGYIITNQHVIDQASKIVVTTTDGKQYEAESVGEDATYDVALLKIKGSDFPYIILGNSEDVIIGEWVIALGNPFGLFDVSSKPTVTVGVVSATGMNFKGVLQVEGRSYQDMIQTDASINSGNSGGPLVNSLGQCIGINTFIISGNEYSRGSVGIGFAIPINRVKKILPDLREMGYVDRSFHTGLDVENINSIVAMMLGISPSDGVIVTQVAKESPGERAGLHAGDVIVAIDGERIHSTSDVQRVINALDITEQKTLTLTVFRKGKLHEVALQLEK